MNHPPTILLVIPIYNEEANITRAVAETINYLETQTVYSYKVLVTDNASTDNSPQIVKNLIKKYPQLSYLRLPEKGRGLALKEAWEQSEEDIVAYMDVDLSSPLEYLPQILDPIINNEADITFGSRLKKPGKAIGRTLKREVTSRVYNRLLQFMLGAKFKDAQCGFKAVRKTTFLEIADQIQNTTWYFDSEMLLLAQYKNYRLQEIPIIWTDDPHSTVKIISTANDNLHHMWRMFKTYKPHSLLYILWWFLFIGGLSTIATLILYSLLRFIVDPQIANIIALTITTIANTVANKRISFRNANKEPIIKTLTISVLSYLSYWIPTATGLWILNHAHLETNLLAEVFTLIIGTVIGMGLKFLLFKIVYHKPVSKPYEVIETTSVAKI